MWGRLTWRPWLRRTAPLTGAPAARRLKTYAAESGYVFHYYCLGQRHWLEGGTGGAEYVFEVSSDRRSWRRISVLLGNEALAPAEARLGRALIAAERYAVAKLTLFQAFDEREDPRGELKVRAADLGGILETLGIE
jgi:hypothetical protein